MVGVRLLTSGCSSERLPNMACSIGNDAAFQQQRGLLSCSVTHFQSTCGQGRHFKVRLAIRGTFCSWTAKCEPDFCCFGKNIDLLITNNWPIHLRPTLTWRMCSCSQDCAYCVCECVHLHVGVYVCLCVQARPPPTIINQKRRVAFRSCWASCFEEWIGTQCEHWLSHWEGVWIRINLYTTQMGLSLNVCMCVDVCMTDTYWTVSLNPAKQWH